jgi:EKC/KEOPS complex subunit PCC1/LAGE3
LRWTLSKSSSYIERRSSYLYESQFKRRIATHIFNSECTTTWQTSKTGKQRTSPAPCTSLSLLSCHLSLTSPRTLRIPFPSAHLASTAQLALCVDAELSPLVRRSISSEDTILVVNYAATTNRMLRVAVNGFIESTGVVIGVMKDLDTDVVYEATKEGLEGVQGLDAGKVG